MEDTEKMQSINSKGIINCIMRWILFGVIIVVAPPLCNVIFRMVVGLNVDFVEYVPDMLLVVLSVCCNLINTCTDEEKRIAHILRWIFCIILGTISVFCWGLFFIVRFNISIISKTSFKIMSKNLFYISLIIIISCVIIGIIIEIYTGQRNKCKK